MFMQKTMKVLSVINIALSVFLAAIYLQFLITSSGSSDGWANLGVFLAMFAFIIIVIILTIPFLVIGIKRKFKDMNFYLITHLVFAGLSVLLFLLSLA